MAVDDTSVFGMDLDRIFLLVLGEEGTEVTTNLCCESASNACADTYMFPRRARF